MPEEPWRSFRVSDDRTHHVDERGNAAYHKTFDEVLSFHPPGLAPASDGVSWFHINPDGTNAYSERFEVTYGFYGGLAAVRDTSGWYHIVPNGSATYSNRWGWCGNFQGERCVVQAREGTFHHIDREGVIRTGPWDYAGDFREGAAAVRLSSGACRHISPEGLFAHDGEFLDLGAYHKGFAVARDAQGWFHIDRRGVACYPQRYHQLEPFYNGLAFGQRDDGTRVRVDPFGVEARIGNGGRDVTQGGSKPTTSRTIPPATLKWLAEVPRDRPVAVLLRHSARDKIPLGKVGADLPLNAEGVALAEELGGHLGPRLRSVRTSPVRRCVETAQILIRSAQSANMIHAHEDRLLGDPGIFVADPEVAWNEFFQVVTGVRFKETLAQLRTDMPGMNDPRWAASQLFEHMTSNGETPGLHLFVTHDALVFPTACHVLGLTLTPADWPEYLDGLFAWPDHDSWAIRYRTHRGRFARTGRNAEVR